MRRRNERRKAPPRRTERAGGRRRRAVADALRASEDRFRNIIDKSADGVVVLRRNGVITFVNPAAEAMLNRGADELVGQMFGVPTAPGETTQIDVLRRNGPALVAEMRLVETEWEGSPSYLATLRDVTERKRVEEAFRFLVEAGDVLAGSLDYGTTLARAARLAVSQLADWCLIDMRIADELVERTAVARESLDTGGLAPRLEGRYPIPRRPAFGLGKLLEGVEPEIVAEASAAFLANLAVDPQQLRAIHRLDCRSAMIVPLVARGKTIGIMSFLSSRVGRRYDDDALALATELARRVAPAIDNARLFEEAQEAVRRRDEFLAMLSHELRNPLDSIVNAGALVRLCAGDVAKLDETGGVIERQGRHMARLLDDLLDLSRITRGKIELRKQPVFLEKVLEAALVACRPAIDGAGHELRVAFPGEPLAASADPTRLEQVFNNLLVNAAKYTHVNGRISVQARRESDEAVIVISDNGVGITPDALPRIFEPFFQSDSSIDRAGGGLGVGLTLVRRLVELHGGSVAAASAGVGLGSQFEVRLPLAKKAAVAPGPRVSTDAPRGCRVLIVEDNHDNREILKSLLAISGHQVRAVANGQDGLDAIRSGWPEVALVDIGLPGIDGYEVARLARRSATNQNVRLIALTGYGRPEDRRQALASGFDAHLVKPVDLSDLQGVLNAENPMRVAVGCSEPGSDDGE